MTTRFKCDLHIHTIASGHAFNTIDECIVHAKDNGYSMIGISDHGPSMEGAPHSGYFEMLYRLPKKSENLSILYGCETNILDESGKLDLDDDILEQLDYVMAGLHRRTAYSCNNLQSNTNAIVNTILSGKVNIITHPVSWNFEVSIQDIVEAAAEKKVLLEANKTIMLDAVKKKRINVIRQYARLLKEAEHRGVAIIWGSDAHHVSEMQLDEYEAKILTDIYGLNLDTFINHSPAKLLEHLQMKRVL